MGASNDFNGAGGNAAPGLTLYHGMRRMPEGEEIRPTCRMRVNGEEDVYLFGTPYIAKAAEYAFSWEDEAIIAGHIDESPNSYIVICRKSRTLEQDRPFRIYAFEGTGFKKTIESAAYRNPIADTREYHATKSIPFSDACLVLQTDNVSDVMQCGLQIIATERTKEELLEAGFMEARRSAPDQYIWLRNLLSNGDFVWVNEEWNVAPDAVLRQKLDSAGTLPSPKAP